MRRKILLLGALTAVVTCAFLGYPPAEVEAAKRVRKAGQVLSTGALFTQPDTLRNSRQVSVADTAQTISIAAVANEQVNLYGLAVHADGAPICTVQVKDGVAGPIVWEAEVTDASASYQFQPALSSSDGNGMDVVVGTCGVGVISTLSMVGSQFD